MSYLDDKQKKKDITNFPLNWYANFGLSEASPAVRLPRDEDGNLLGLPVTGFASDPSSGTVRNFMPMAITDAQPGTNANSYARAFGTPAAAMADTSVGLLTNDRNMVYNNAAAAGKEWEAQRTPNIFKAPANITAVGSTAVWTPAGGKKVRILGYAWTLRNDSTTVGGSTITLKDNVTTFANLTGLGLTTGGTSNTVPLGGNGYLSLAADNVINVNCSGALTAGGLVISLWGTEE